MHVYGELHGTLTSAGRLQGTLVSDHTITGALTIPSDASTEPYTGEYEFTPTQNTQVVEIEHKRASRNIIINPIPQNYGLITWDGSKLTVS